MTRFDFDAHLKEFLEHCAFVALEDWYLGETDEIRVEAYHGIKRVSEIATSIFGSNFADDIMEVAECHVENM